MILVTGAFGCLGSTMVRALVERGERVVALARPGESPGTLSDLADHFETRTADVRDPEAVARAMRGIEGVFHLAGVATLTTAAARAMYEVNVLGTANVMREARRAGARVVHTSSVSAIGLPPSEQPADEDFPFNGHLFRHPYPRTKHAGEQRVLDEVRRGLDAVILNPGAVMAPGGDGRSAWPAFVGAVCRGKLPFAPPGGFSMVAAEEFVTAQIRAFEKGTVGERYIVATQNMTFLELISSIAGAAGVRPPRRTVPPRVLAAAAYASLPFILLVKDPERRPLVSPENLVYLNRNLYYDSRKSREHLGVAPGSMEESILSVVSWGRRHGIF